MPTRSPAPMQRGEIADMLREHGIAPTHQRIEIAGVMFSRHEHFSADQLLEIVNARYSEVSKATVYNSLRLFLEKKLVREVIVDPTRVFYDPNTAPHHHFYNMASGELTDIHDDSLKLAGMPIAPEGMETDSIDIIVRIRPSQPATA
ncbi:MAG: Fur family transcriptional regulator [Pseudomonadota bacterium]|nr:Fur family transcriptional regulator [Pseudomonadota bacterium]MDP1902839.1 Fur family transcriptional regulator [Pseudomonadota bacterium]MDP2352847.1 Fur family transcriptional regulator [Pseudomonadota bacterium]